MTLGSLLVIVAALTLYGVWAFWPAEIPATGQAPAKVQFTYFGWRANVTRDQQFFVVVALAGALGAMLHALRSLARYVGERFLFRSWILYYALLPPVGSILATIVYLVLRAGLLSGASTRGQADPYGVAAIAGLVGLFSAQASSKLKAVFETVFTSDPAGADSVADVTVPKIATANPHHGPVGTSVVLTGSGMSLVKAVRFGDVPTTLTIDSNSQITTVVPSAAKTAPITIHTDGTDVSTTGSFVVDP